MTLKAFFGVHFMLKYCVVFILFLSSCRVSESTASSSSSLPFACAGESASEIYFDPSQAEMLQGKIESSGIRNLVVFGDSMSDTGRLGRKSHDAIMPQCN